MISPSYMPVHVPGARPFHYRILPKSCALCRSGKRPRRPCSGFLARARSCTICIAIPTCKPKGSVCRVLLVRFGRFYESSARSLPSEIDPDRWVDRLHGRAYVRHVGADGCVTVDERPYSVGLEHKGKAVAGLFNAPSRSFEAS